MKSIDGKGTYTHYVSAHAKRNAFQSNVLAILFMHCAETLHNTTDSTRQFSVNVLLTQPTHKTTNSAHSTKTFNLLIQQNFCHKNMNRKLVCVCGLLNKVKQATIQCECNFTWNIFGLSMRFFFLALFNGRRLFLCGKNRLLFFFYLISRFIICAKCQIQAPVNGAYQS